MPRWCGSVRMPGMTWHSSGDVDAFLTHAGDFLLQAPARNIIMLSVARRLQLQGPQSFSSQPSRFGWWTADDKTVTGAYLQTPPRPLLLSPSMPVPAVTALADQLADDALTGVGSTATTATGFADRYLARVGRTSTIAMRLRQYELGELVPPTVAGRARIANAADLPLLRAWHGAFYDEATEDRGNIDSAIAGKLAYGGLTLWEVDDVPVSMAGGGRSHAGVVSIGPVYTPPAHRRCGYGAAVTAADSKAALVAGATTVVLYTDLANPTSNSIYQKIGYRPLEDRVSLKFH